MSLYAPVPVGTAPAVAGGRVCVPLILSPRAPGEARRLVEDTLARWNLDDLAGAAALIVSELVTNVVLHGHAPALLAVYTDPGADGGFLFVEVEDAGPGKPEKQAADDDAEDGRGLAIVGALAQDWGVEAVDGGKRVWASIAFGAGTGEAR